MNRTNESMMRITHSPEETSDLARDLAAQLAAGDIVVLDGPLGAGKTCFVRGLAAGLGLDPSRVSSPTYVICHEYRGEQGRRLVHVDAYRLSGPEELESIGWRDLLEAEHTIIAVEWPGRIASALPEKCIRVELEHVSETERRVTISDGERND